jgi:hypothetical protein
VKVRAVLRDHCIVRPLDGLAQDHWTFLEIPEKSRSLGYFFAEVVAVGAGVTDEVRPGCRVIVDRNSAALTLGEGADRLLVVRCTNARPAPRREDELAYRMVRLKALQKLFPKGVRPPQVVAELDDHGQAIEEIRRLRRRWGRSRLFNPTLDPGLGEGIVAVVDDEPAAEAG